MPGVDEDLEIIVFDAQPSGGLSLAVPEEKVDLAKQTFKKAGDLACIVGEVLPPRNYGKVLVLHQ